VRGQFEKAKQDASMWLKGLLAPLRLQIAEHKAQLDKRTESLMKIHENQSSLQKNITELEEQLSALQNQSATLDQILLKLMKAAQKSGNQTATSPAPAETAGGPTLGVAPLVS
jgi:septal ring factor EnvC (AmiA/AmiB activator)